jgi:hypothetical protein
LIGFGQENFTFELAEFDNTGKAIKFEPNISGVTRLGLNAFGFGVGYSLRNSDKETRPNIPKTKFSDWQLGYHSARWGIDTYYQTYEGFYTTNTNALVSFPNLNFKHQGLTFRYALEESEFSVGKIVDQAENITSDAGKVYLVFGWSQHQMDTDAPLLQFEHAGANPEVENLKSLKSTSVKFGAGGGKYWISESKFFVGGLIDLLSTYSNLKYESTTGNSDRSDFTTSFNLKIGGGYAGEKFKTGISLVGDVTQLKTPGGALLKPSANRILIYFRTVFDL